MSRGQWQGRVKHRLDSEGHRSIVELFGCTAALPESILERLPPVVYVSSLASRDSVRLRRHTMYPLRMGPLTAKQHLKLVVRPINGGLDTPHAV